MILKYKLVENAKGDLSVPEYVTDGGYFSSNGNNDEWLVGIANSNPEGTVELSVQDLRDYVVSLTMNKMDMATMESSAMTEQDKIDAADAWMKERGLIE